MSANTSKPGLAMQHSSSWFQISISDISLEEPYSKALNILKDKSEDYTQLLYKLYLGTVKQAKLEKAGIRESLDSLFTEYPKKHFLAALIIGSIVNEETIQAHLAYQELLNSIIDDLIELNSNIIKQNEKDWRALAREGMPAAKVHIRHKDAQHRGQSGGKKSSRFNYGNFKNVCRIADTLLSEDKRKGYLPEIKRCLEKENADIPARDTMNDYLCIWNELNDFVLGKMKLKNITLAKKDEVIAAFTKPQQEGQKNQ